MQDLQHIIDKKACVMLYRATLDDINHQQNLLNIKT